MRILQVAPLVAPIDEQEQIGGAQVLVAELTRGLVRAGHDVTLAAADGSSVQGARLAPLGIDPHMLRPTPLAAHAGPREDDAAQRRAFERVREWIDAHANEFDVVHAHAYDAPAFDTLRGSPRPVVHTLHLPPADASVVAAAARASSDATLVTVSEANARAWHAHGVAVAEMIHNGIDVAAIALGTRRGSHLLYAGRLSPEKGVEVALDVADRAGRGILLVGGIYDAEYHARMVAPRVRTLATLEEGPIRDAVYIGPRPRREVHRLMSEAAATLMPVRWDEPFGLVAVESLAAGTPVVASRRGGLVEIVDDSVGALVKSDDRDGFVRAIERVATVDRRLCRARAERFDVGAMVERYLGLYRALADAG